MKQSEKMMVNTGAMMLAFAYEMNGYQSAALAVGGISLLLAIQSHSGNSFIACLPKAAGFTVLTVLVCLYTGFLPTRIFVFLLFVNHVCALLWSKSSFKAIRITVKMIFISYLSFLSFALLLSPIGIGLFAADATILAVIRIQCMDLPMLLGYFVKCIKRSRKALVKKSYRHIMLSIVEGNYDKLAGQTLYR